MDSRPPFVPGFVLLIAFDLLHCQGERFPVLLVQQSNIV